jgi:hypothetical protein
MNFFDIAYLVLLLVWAAAVALQIYGMGYAKGEEAGRKQACRCRREGLVCPHAQKEGQ